MLFLIMGEVPHERPINSSKCYVMKDWVGIISILLKKGIFAKAHIAGT